MFSKQVSEAVRVLTGIVRLQKGPEDLPFSTPLLLLVIVASCVLDAVTLAVVPLSDQPQIKNNAALLIAIGLAMTLIWYGGLLRIAGKSERFTQTLTAVFGFQIILAPALLFTAWFYSTYFQDPTWKMPAGLLRSVVEIWVLVILARILSVATQWPMFACVMLAIANELLSALLIFRVVAPPAALS